MKKYTYTGKEVMNFTLNHNQTNMDVMLSNGQDIELPEDNQHVKDLVYKGYLVESSTSKKKKNDE